MASLAPSAAPRPRDEAGIRYVHLGRTAGIGTFGQHFQVCERPRFE